MITFDKISFLYKGTKEKSLADISFHIPKGQCVLLCGLSGCGKTTLTRLINGLIPYFFEGRLTGQTKVRGIDAAKVDISTLSDVVGTVFQNPRTQFFNTDTDSEIVFGLENRGLSQQELRHDLERVYGELGMENLRGRSIFELSGGEKQKIAFASVYASDPEIFVLDEPSSNLDYRSVRDLQKLILKIKRRGKTIVIAEHRIWYLMDLVDRVIFMEKGKITEDIGIGEFSALSEKDAALSELRCRDLSEIKGSCSSMSCANRRSKSVTAAMRPGKPKPETVSVDLSRTGHDLEVEDLTVRLGKQAVLNGVSFGMRRGEILAVTGENGAGKTTLARAICGLVKQEEGEIRLDGNVLSRKRRRKNSYMVMQDVGHQLFTDSVYAECCLGTKKEKQGLIDETLELLLLSDLRQRHPMSLSGGQKQRLAVAVSMLCDKELLIFDEPTSGLDLKSMKEVGSLMQRLAEEEKIIFVITHDIEFIKTICSRVIIMSGGRIAQEISEGQKGELENSLKRAENKK